MLILLVFVILYALGLLGYMTYRWVKITSERKSG
jgi:hypothetical protein